MEIKVNIPKNDYVQPTEVRQEIVQMICDYIIKRMEDKHFHEEDSYDVIIGHHEWFYQLYLGINRKSNTPFSFSSSDKHCVGDVTYIRIRTAEMQAVFAAIQDAGYYEKPYSLILSARIGGERIETIEVDLVDYTIKQCYGKHDQFTIHHQRILDLVNSQMGTIKAYNKKRNTKIKIAV